VQEAQARAQEQALNMAKLSRRPEEVLRDLENEAEVLKNLHQKISQQLHMLQVRAQQPPPSPSSCGEDTSCTTPVTAEC
jgi:hypothetical protein